MGGGYQRKQPHWVGRNGEAALPTEAVLWKGEMGKLRLLVPALGVPHCPTSLRRVERRTPASCPCPNSLCFWICWFDLMPGYFPFLSSAPLPRRTGQVGGLWLVGGTSLEKEGEWGLVRCPQVSLDCRTLIPAWLVLLRPPTPQLQDRRLWEVIEKNSVVCVCSLTLPPLAYM